MEQSAGVHSFFSMVWIRQIINCRDMKSLFSYRYKPGLIRAAEQRKGWNKR